MIRTSQISAATLVALAATFGARDVAAQTQQVCFTDTIPMTTTNWVQSVTIPKFDQQLGTLQSIDFSLTGQIQGSVRIESLDQAPSIVNSSFAGTITLTRPDNSVLVVVLPAANFSDALSAFDGTIDFMGTSGVQHPGVSANQTNTVTSPPPASDLILFSGPAGNPGTITLPVSAAGTSLASGSGNLITQFQQEASADVQVCYTYVPNTPPTITCPGGQVTTIRTPLQFTVCASDPDPNETVTLTATGLPAGALVTPSLPASGNPVCVTVDFMAQPDQVGTFVITFTATDGHLRTQTCTVTITVAECHVVFGPNPGTSQQLIYNHLFDTQIDAVHRVSPSTEASYPAFVYSLLPRSFTAQVVMHNPFLFPGNPSQHSFAVRVTKQAGNTISLQNFGTQNNITLSPAVIIDGQGVRRIEFPFDVIGM